VGGRGTFAEVTPVGESFSGIGTGIDIKPTGYWGGINRDRKRGSVYCRVKFDVTGKTRHEVKGKPRKGQCGMNLRWVGGLHPEG